MPLIQNNAGYLELEKMLFYEMFNQTLKINYLYEEMAVNVIVLHVKLTITITLMNSHIPTIALLTLYRSPLEVRGRRMTTTVYLHISWVLHATDTQLWLLTTKIS